MERGGKLYWTDARFTDEGQLRRVIDKITAKVGRRIDEATPYVDARLPDGSRVWFLSRERPIYHMCRLVIRHGASKPEQGVWLYLDRVDRAGRRTTFEVQRLDQPPEVP